MGLVFSALYGTNGLGFLVGDTQSGSVTDRKRAVNDGYVELCALAAKAYWRVRSHDYTSSSSPAMTAGSHQLSVPTSPAFESPYRLYFRENGMVRDVPFISRSEWLDRSDTSQSGYPSNASLVQTASAKRIDLDVLLSSEFVSNIATLTLEYFIEVTRLSADADEPILPESLRHHILPVAGYLYALGQGDLALADRLKLDMELAKEAVRVFDVTHVARPRQIRPTTSYAPSDGDEVTTDYNR